jgi:hypothetical protein
MDEVALLLPEVRPPIFRRVGGRINPALGVGTSFLPVTESEGRESSGGGACARLQVDQDHLEMLADAHQV